MVAGRRYIHPEFGIVLCQNRVKRTKDLFLVLVVDRGPGWDEKHQWYRGITKKFGENNQCTAWERGENVYYGELMKLRSHEVKPYKE